MLWKTTGYRMDDGWGINLAGSGRPIQITLGTSADLEVDGGYLSSGGPHLTNGEPAVPSTFLGESNPGADQPTSAGLRISFPDSQISPALSLSANAESTITQSR